MEFKKRASLFGVIISDMLGIDLQYFNEMLRYEADMNNLRALTLWITQPENTIPRPGLPKPIEQVFLTIKHYSRYFAIPSNFARGDQFVPQ